MYDTVVKQTGKAGRPRKYGERLSAKKDFILSSEKINGYFISTRMVFTNLFGKHIVQEFRFAISEQIREQIIFANFAEILKKCLNAKNVINLVKQKVFGFSSAAQKL